MGCPPSLILHGRNPFNPVDLRFNNKTLPRFDYIGDLQSKTSRLFGETKESIVLAFNQYRNYYDKKAKAFPLKVHEYCMLLNPQISDQHEKIGKLESKWTGIYRIEKVLTRSSYLIRRIDTKFTQIFHRVRLKPFKPQYIVEDIEVIDDKNFCVYPLIPDNLKESQLFDSQIEQIVYRAIDNRSTPSVRTAIKPQLSKTPKNSFQQRPKTPPNNPKNVIQITPQNKRSHTAHHRRSKLHMTICRFGLTLKVARQAKILMSRDPVALQFKISKNLSAEKKEMVQQQEASGSI